MREAGFAPGHGPGYTTLAAPGRDAGGIAEGLASGELHTVWLHHVDPLRNYPDRPLWERALGTAQTVIAVESQMTDTVREFADVVFPAEAYPEKEGTLVHPDGRLQRLRPAIGRPRGAGGQPGSGVRPLWQVIADVARALGYETGDFRTGAQVSRRLFEAVPFYAGLTLEEIGGRGVRWVEREEFVSPAWEAATLDIPAGRARRRRRQAAPRHLPPAVGGQGGRPLARAALHPRPPGRRALAGRRRRARASTRATGSRSATAPACARTSSCAPRSRPAASSSPRARARTTPTCSRTGWSRSTASVPARSSRAPSPAQIQPAVEGLAEAPPSAALPIPPREVT